MNLQQINHPNFIPNHTEHYYNFAIFSGFKAYHCFKYKVARTSNPSARYKLLFPLIY